MSEELLRNKMVQKGDRIEGIVLVERNSGGLYVAVDISRLPPNNFHCTYRDTEGKLYIKTGSLPVVLGGLPAELQSVVETITEAFAWRAKRGSAKASFAGYRVVNYS